MKLLFFKLICRTSIKSDQALYCLSWTVKLSQTDLSYINQIWPGFVLPQLNSEIESNWSVAHQSNLTRLCLASAEQWNWVKLICRTSIKSDQALSCLSWTVKLSQIICRTSIKSDQALSRLSWTVKLSQTDLSHINQIWPGFVSPQLNSEIESNWSVAHQSNLTRLCLASAEQWNWVKLICRTSIKSDQALSRLSWTVKLSQTDLSHINQIWPGFVLPQLNSEIESNYLSHINQIWPGFVSPQLNSEIESNWSVAHQSNLTRLCLASAEQWNWVKLICRTSIKSDQALSRLSWTVKLSQVWQKLYFKIWIVLNLKMVNIARGYFNLIKQY